ncbi:2-C-methyl-D-erythritol 4-phosphate cytidylyltransferase [Clostridium tepidiprofundi DSM 19306]|uniref:2-C-methyl-D-erythritol 4-phosphate cytidylyltransferase n=1 Tax=Clostridium tepidiprofundi DSM 19306 TaxID=1121338 RepID=A0A151B692_9CLOT|nr:2-C-methyl-D-erythritol 4-phosphate cytidylyltransferase [Clostridium tepidiprofundi]KYH35167.1 2-C-methyl-D-erythritol 4-phosphate cytidylyltransferase [Clostridium tepidiprofundi DSM 19306]
MGKNCAIILAAGKGKRMGTGINKQFLLMNNKPILYYTLKVFSECDDIHDIILVAAENEVEYCIKEIVNENNFTKVSKVVAGGNERHDSVLNGLKAIEECEIVLIHDGARPFVDSRILKDGIMFARIHGACACGVVPKDTIKIRDNFNLSKGTLNRRELFMVQTPQCFKYELILECHEKIAYEDIVITDDTMVVEKFNNSVYLYDGSYDNIKITTPEDLIIGEKILFSKYGCNY